EILAHSVFGKLTARDLVQVDDGDGDRLPAKSLGGPQSALTGNEDSVRPHDDGLQQPQLTHAIGQRCNVAHLAAMGILSMGNALIAATANPVACSFHGASSVLAFQSSYSCGSHPRHH